MPKSFSLQFLTLAYRILLANIFTFSIFAATPDYMNLSPYDAAKAWHHYQDSNIVETFRQFRKFIRAFSGKFPLDHIRKRAEEAAYKRVDSNQKTIRYFEFNPILTAKGLIAYVRALVATNQTDSINAVVRKYWLGLDFSISEMKIFIDLAKPFLKYNDYLQKLDALLSQEKHENAHDFLKYVKKDDKIAAQLRLTIQKNDDGAKAAVAKALKNFKSNSGVMHDVTRWYRKQYETDKSIALLESLDQKAETASPLLWWNERNVLSRRKMEEKNWQAAYNLITKHKLIKGEAYANAEWMLGWIELTKLKQQDKAAKRFIELHGRVNMPVSKSRMAFWAAEALMAIKKEDRAKEYYLKAAAYRGTFYGQIAISRLKAIKEDIVPLELDNHTISNEAKEAFDKRFIIQCLKAYGENLQVDLQLTLLSFAGTELTVAGEEILTTELGYQLGGSYLSVFVAKKVQHMGTVLTRHGYPTLDERLRKDLFTKLPQLIQCIAHGIIRQESNFHEAAESTAKAKGLMQLMDATAAGMRKLAHQYGLPSISGGIQDRRVNVTLGTTHILQHLENYGGYLVLALAAYNAGDSNVNEWIKIFGDPRKTGDWLNWIERIPFGETRNYIHRVLENTIVYSAILLPKQHFEIIDWVARPIPYVVHKKHKV